MTTRVGGIGKDAIKANNMFALLFGIYKNGPMSRRDLAKRVELTPSTVTLLVGEMIAYGLLREGQEIDEAPRAGRKMVPVEINPAFGVILGVCVEPGRLFLALSDLGGCALDHMAVKNTYGQDELLLALLDKARELISRQIRPVRLCAIGISISGRVDPALGVSVDSYGILPPGTDVAQAFEDAFLAPSFLDNNVRSLAGAELALEKSGEDTSGLFIKHGPGFGCAVLLEGQLFEGARFSAGEIGHAKVIDHGLTCICGKTGCLSTVVSTEALIRGSQLSLSPASTPALWAATEGLAEAITVQALVQSAAAGDRPIMLILDEAARMMARAIETALLAMDGDQVITYGQIFKDDWFFDRLTSALNDSFGVFRSIRVIRSRLSDEDRWKGAVQVALSQYLRFASAQISAQSGTRNDE